MKNKKLNSSLVLYVPLFLVSLVYITVNLFGMETYGIYIKLDGVINEGIGEGIGYKLTLITVYLLVILKYKSVGKFFYDQYIVLEDTINGKYITFKVIQGYKTIKNQELERLRLRYIKHQIEVINEVKGNTKEFWEIKGKIYRDKLFERRFTVSYEFEGNRVKYSI